MKYYIIGFMGSGKSTFGSKLAGALGYSFLDMDKEIEKKAGLSISQIFEKQGEEAFRKIEAEVLTNTFGLENYVIAAGGGTPCFNDNMQQMNEKGKTIYIKLFENELYKRLEPEQDHRPLIKNKTSEELQAYIYQTLRQRAVFYHRATMVLDGMNMNAEELASSILAAKPVDIENER